MVRYLKRLKSSKFVRVKAFPMYGDIGVSAPSLHRESTDSLIRNGQNAITPLNKIHNLYCPSHPPNILIHICTRHCLYFKASYISIAIGFFRNPRCACMLRVSHKQLLYNTYCKVSVTHAASTIILSALTILSSTIR